MDSQSVWGACLSRQDKLVKILLKKLVSYRTEHRWCTFGIMQALMHKINLQRRLQDSIYIAAQVIYDIDVLNSNSSKNSGNEGILSRAWKFSQRRYLSKQNTSTPLARTYNIVGIGILIISIYVYQFHIGIFPAIEDTWSTIAMFTYRHDLLRMRR